MLGFWTMRSRTLLSAAACAALAFAALLYTPAAHAQIAAKADSGVLVLYNGDMPVAHEDFAYQVAGDSIMVTALHQRQLLDENKVKHVFEKAMLLVVDARDLALRRYTSNQTFQGHTALRGLLITDTVMTYYKELDTEGDAVRIALPPGRLFVFDSSLFTLFDVICRSLAGKEFETRRLQVLEMAADSLQLPATTVTRVRPDTLTLGGKRIPTRRYVLDDAGVRFDLWADHDGRMMRVQHDGTGLRVERLFKPENKPQPAVRPKRAPRKS